MSCRACLKDKTIVSINGKTSDLCFTQYPNGTCKDGYVPSGLGIGGGDYIEFDFCVNCGAIQGDFPIYTAEFGEFDD